MHKQINTHSEIRKGREKMFSLKRSEAARQWCTSISTETTDREMCCVAAWYHRKSKQRMDTLPQGGKGDICMNWTYTSYLCWSPQAGIWEKLHLENCQSLFRLPSKLEKCTALKDFAWALHTEILVSVFTVLKQVCIVSLTLLGSFQENKTPKTKYSLIIGWEG